MDSKDQFNYNEMISVSKKDWKSLQRKVNRFLIKKKFGTGFPMTISMIQEVLEKRKKEIAINDSNKINIPLYLKFLTHYGRIYGGGFCIIGPNVLRDREGLIEEMCLEQGKFEYMFRKIIDKSLMKYYWFIAQEPERGAYYFNFTEKGKGRIYYINREGKSHLFLENFLDFLDQLYDDYELYYDSENECEK